MNGCQNGEVGNKVKKNSIKNKDLNGPKSIAKFVRDLYE